MPETSAGRTRETLCSDDLDRRVRSQVYRHFIDAGRPPRASEVARQLTCTSEEIRASWRRLARGRALVLTPTGDGIRFAPPFSAIPSPNRVRVDGQKWWAPCVWDALGIPAMLHRDAQVLCRCPSSDEWLELTVKDGALTGSVGVIHLLVPARYWWEDIGFT